MSWYIDTGKDSDVILSSRIRLARNLADVPFPQRLTPAKAHATAERIIKAYFSAGRDRQDYLLVELDRLSEEESRSLVERRLISEDLACSGAGRCSIISRDESLSIMIHEEDHIRIQAMAAGLSLEQAQNAAREEDLVLQRGLPIAYDERFGFLTACPTNTGTGMRASVMAHLPGLIQTGRIKDLIEAMGKMGFAVRGGRGEHSRSEGSLYQISNQLTLGISEEDVLNDLEHMLRQLMEQERQARRELYSRSALQVEDRVFRALGMLRHARLLTSEEAMDALSDLRLGLALDLLPDLTAPVLNRIMAAIGPANIQKARGRLLSAQERDEARAQIVRDLICASS